MYHLHPLVHLAMGRVGRWVNDGRKETGVKRRRGGEKHVGGDLRTVQVRCIVRKRKSVISI